MATLQTLRNKAGVLLAVIIGLSLLAFILGDFLNSGSGFMTRKRTEIAEINGKSINYQEYSTRVEQGVENYKQSSGISAVDEQTYASIRNQVWNGYMNEFVYSDEYNKLGLACTPDELFDMVQGKNIHPQIQQAQIFQNKQTGGFDRNLVMQFLKSLDQDPTGRQRQAWVNYEKELMKDRVYTKYQTLITKGMYVTRKMVDAEFVESNKKFDFNFVPLRYATTPDSLIKISESEVQKYYNEHLEKFQQDASRDLEYVVWDILPSQEDKDVVVRWINEQKPEFERIENAAQYVAATGESPFSEVYYGNLDLPETIKAWALAADKGMVFGPYQEGMTWKLARITDVKELPDSVKASHILIRPVNDTDFDAAQKTADSIKGLIDRGQDFGALATQFGTDGTKDKGGDLGWFTMDKMIPEFSKACFFATKNEVLTVRTSYGVHVIKVTEQAGKSKKVQLAILDRTITASDKTVQDIYNVASKFASMYDNGTKFENGIVKENMNKRLATNLREGDAAITGLDNPRELVRWAFEAKKGDLSELKEYGPRFVLAKLSEVREAGTAPLAQVRTQVENSVRNARKADYLAAQAEEFLKSSNTLDALAAKFNSNVSPTAGAYFTSYTINGMGMEPQVSAALTFAPLNQVSKPIKGTSGVYVIQVTNITEPDLAANRNESRTRLEQSYTSRAGYEIFAALEKTAKVVDKRNKFY
ncbi:MAG: SurA N-terminal domain-containing protein [Bacteroidales bacterium]